MALPSQILSPLGLDFTSTWSNVGLLRETMHCNNLHLYLCEFGLTSGHGLSLLLVAVGLNRTGTCCSGIIIGPTVPLPSKILLKLMAQWKCKRLDGDWCSVEEAQNGSCGVEWRSLMPRTDTSITDKVTGCQSAFTSRAYPAVCLVNKSFLISVLLFTSPTEFAVVFIPFLF